MMMLLMGCVIGGGGGVDDGHFRNKRKSCVRFSSSLWSSSRNSMLSLVTLVVVLAIWNHGGVVVEAASFEVDDVQIVDKSSRSIRSNWSRKTIQPPPLTKFIVNEETGSYSIHVGTTRTNEAFATTEKTKDDTTKNINSNDNNDFVTWLQSGETILGDWNSNDGTLQLTNSKVGTSNDTIFGTYTYREWEWSASTSTTDNVDEHRDDNNNGAKEVVMVTSVRTYEDYPSMFIMEQSFPRTFVNKPIEQRKTQLSSISVFPSFLRNPGVSNDVNTNDSVIDTTTTTTTDDLACISYHEIFAVSKYCHLSDYKESILGGIPLVVYNESDIHLPTMILSPINKPMASQMSTTSTIFGIGIKANVTVIPQHWKQSFLLSFDYGINNAFTTWGNYMKRLNQAEAAEEKGDESSPPPYDNNEKEDVILVVDGDFAVEKEIYRTRKNNNKKMNQQRLLRVRKDVTHPKIQSSPAETTPTTSSTPDTTTSSRRHVPVVAVNNDDVEGHHHDSTKDAFPYNFYRDQTHSTIGFWTDNGGYYHYNTGIPNATYEEVLPLVKAYHESIGVPFGHWQIDSWFYPKDGRTSRGGKGGALVNWTALEEVFPSGIPGIQKKLGMPFIMHARQFSNRSDYIHNWTDIEWYTGPKHAMAKDPEKFFRRFFTQQVDWGLAMYEQDWMLDQYFGVEALQTNISMGDMWLEGMAIGAGSQNVAIQYCMPYPNMIMTASKHTSVVTNARASHDYGPDKVENWAIGMTSLFYWALGILPMKDAFYSSTLRQEGGFPEGPETRPDLQALISTLSCSMVGPADGMNFMNATRINSVCRSDGYILKPDRPLRTSDVCFYVDPSASDDLKADHDPTTCYTYLTHSDIPGMGRVTYLFANDTDKIVTPAMAHLSDAPNDKYAVYNWYTRDLELLEDFTILAPGYEGHGYAIISPILDGGWVFLGEVDKFVPASRFRFSKVSSDDGVLNIAASGVPGEQIRVCAAQSMDLKAIQCKSMTFGPTLSHNLSFETAHLVSQS